MKSKIKKLNEEFGIENHLEFVEKKGLICAEIKNDFASSEIYLNGAHLASFIPKNSEDIFWVSEKSYYQAGKPIRGGIPICWPWFGAHKNNSKLPSHGFARFAEWDVIQTATLNDGSTQIVFELNSNNETRQKWEYNFNLKYIVHIADELEVELITTNTDSAPFEITSALHSYFKVADITDISISGLEDALFIDTLDGNKEKTENCEIRIDQNVDRVYLNTDSACCIKDNALNRNINIRKAGSFSTVVWNPWIAKAAEMLDYGDEEFKNMVCVETTNVFTDKVMVYPNTTHSLKAIISLGV